MRRHTVPRLRPWLPWTLLAITQTWNRLLLGQLDTEGGDQRGDPSSHSQETRSPLPHLVQGSHRHFAYIVGYMLPAGALRVAGGDPCSVPQVPWGGKQPRSSDKSFWPILACCGVNSQLFSPPNPSHPRALLDDLQPGAWATASPVSLCGRLHKHPSVPFGAHSPSLSAGAEAEDKGCLKQMKRDLLWRQILDSKTGFCCCCLGFCGVFGFVFFVLSQSQPRLVSNS